MNRWKWALIGAGVLLALEVAAFVLLSYVGGPHCTPRVWFAGNTGIVSCF